MSFDTSQSLPRMPGRAVCASTSRRTKKNAMRARMPPASAVSPQRSPRSGKRARSGRSRKARPLVMDSTAMRGSGAGDRGAVAGQRLGGRLGLGQQRRRQLGELQLAELLLAVVEREVDE